MKANVLALALLSLCACDQSQTVSPDTSHVVTTPTHDCAKQRFASINANGGTFKLTGTCEAVFVNGVNNRITIEASKKVIVDGGKNVMQIIASDQGPSTARAIPSSLRRGSLAKRPLWSRSVTTTMSFKKNKRPLAAQKIRSRHMSRQAATHERLQMPLCTLGARVNGPWINLRVGNLFL